MAPATPSKAHVRMGGNRFMPGWCHAIVAIAMRNQGWDEVTQVPLTIAFADALVEPGPARFTPGLSAGVFVNRFRLPFGQSRIS
ncbi:MAG: hypothetical protein Q8M18_00420 [Bradyrhizobium sp.]|nr:hypothetical protein [Bradyrhizobium sp.]